LRRKGPVVTALDRAFDPRNNSLNFLRLVLALAVIVSHQWPLGGYGPEPVVAGLTPGTWAVAGFFAISGYLIANSRLNMGFPPFLARRVLRIYPGFLVCLLVVALFFAPLSTVLGEGTVHWSSAASFVGRNVFLKIEQNSIDATLPNAPYGPAWNGSLWTLFYEFVCYLGIGVLLSTAARWRGPLTVAAWLGCAGAYVAFQHHIGPSGNATLVNMAELGAVFFAGSVLAVFAGRVPMDWRLGIAAAVVAVAAGQLGWFTLVGSLPAAYLCLWLGIVLPCQRIGRRTDISYGVYIYAFPVQQTLNLLHVNRLPVGFSVLVSAAVTVPFAFASWFLVEKPALSQKARFAAPRRVAERTAG
jgi:peptidoglycan/LPS O-acetylase OafA/YrhL